MIICPEMPSKRPYASTDCGFAALGFGSEMVQSLHENIALVDF